MPPVRTQKKIASSPQGMDLALFGFKKVAKAEALAAAANAKPILHWEEKFGSTSSQQEKSLAQKSGSTVSSSAQASQQSSSSLNLKPKPRLPKPVVAGVRHAHFVDSGMTGMASTIELLARKYIDDIVSMGPRVCSVRTEFAFQYTNVDYDAHNDAHSLTDQGVILLTQHCPNLKKLLLPGTYLLGDTSLCYSLSRCRLLTNLEITGSRNITAAGFAELERHPEWAPNLKKLRIGEQSERPSMKGMREFSKSRPTLPIELVSTSQEKQYESWSLRVSHDTYVKGTKEKWRATGSWKRAAYDFTPYEDYYY